MPARRKAAVASAIGALALAVAFGWASTSGRALRSAVMAVGEEMSLVAEAAQDLRARVPEEEAPAGSLPVAPARDPAKAEALRALSAAMKAALEAPAEPGQP